MGPETRLEGCSRNRTEEGVGGNEWPVTSDVAFRRFFDLTVFPKNRAAMLKGDGGVFGREGAALFLLSNRYYDAGGALRLRLRPRQAGSGLGSRLPGARARLLSLFAGLKAVGRGKLISRMGRQRDAHFS